MAEPGVDLDQRSGIEGVDPPGALGTHGREAVLAQHPEVLRDARLREAELVTVRSAASRLSTPEAQLPAARQEPVGMRSADVIASQRSSIAVS